MPYLNCKLSVDESEGLADKVVSLLLKNTSDILGKKEEVTAINIEFVSRYQNYRGYKYKRAKN